MPRYRHIPFTLSLVLTILLGGSGAVLLAQGPLTPPTAPSPTMKTLQQVEPRTDIAKVPGDIFVQHRITEPGSYYLSGNLHCVVACIEIRASGVTLDLNGFRITRPSGSAVAIRIGQSADVLSDITIKNGSISGTTISSAILESSTTDPKNVRVTGITVSNVSGDGINLGADPSNSVDRCSVRSTGGSGITAGEVSHSTALGCSGTAIAASGSVSHSRGESTGASGIAASENVSDSVGVTTSTNQSARGILAGVNVSNSSGRSSGDYGILAGGQISNSFGVGPVTGLSGAAVSHSFGGSETGDGIQARVISYSIGEASSGAAFKGGIAVGCAGYGSQVITHKYLMP